jgi:hypothetical protein
MIVTFQNWLGGSHQYSAHRSLQVLQKLYVCKAVRTPESRVAKDKITDKELVRSLFSRQVRKRLKKLLSDERSSPSKKRRRKGRQQNRKRRK